jgi:hypothetical protein
MARKVKPKKKTKPKTSPSHLQYESVSNLVEKVVCATDIEEKIKWSWGVMKECEILESSKVTKKHVEKCESCKDFLNSRKLLAKLVIQGGRMQG